ncbi:MAG: sporulation regulator WhiA [Haloplasmataceae bacterium]|nr:sporulation regulator WhiA [Haloplasmataceae bacterium]
MKIFIKHEIILNQSIEGDKMSFASETKNELITLVVSDCCAKAELSALTRMNGIINISSEGLRIEFQTQNPAIARRFVKLIRQLYDVDIDLLTRKQMHLNKGNIYIVRISKYTDMIISDLELMVDNCFLVGTPKNLLLQKCCNRAYLRGAFLASGSVNNPVRSSYHLEIFMLDEELALDIKKIANLYDLNARTIKRKKGFIVYIKESEKIADFLRVINATNALLDFEDIRIYRDLNNSVNRIRNCEVANLNKSWDASNNQIDNINLITETVGIDILPDKLLDVAKLRIKYHDATLTELSDLYYEEYRKIISKSGLNHRFRKINLIAEKIRNSEKLVDLDL